MHADRHCDRHPCAPEPQPERRRVISPGSLSVFFFYGVLRIMYRGGGGVGVGGIVCRSCRINAADAAPDRAALTFIIF